MEDLKPRLRALLFDASEYTPPKIRSWANTHKIKLIGRCCQFTDYYRYTVNETIRPNDVFKIVRVAASILAEIYEEAPPPIQIKPMWAQSVLQTTS